MLHLGEAALFEQPGELRRRRELVDGGRQIRIRVAMLADQAADPRQQITEVRAIRGSDARQPRHAELQDQQAAAGAQDPVNLAARPARIDDVADAELVQITGKKTFQVIAGAEKAELKADDTQILVQHKQKPISVLADQDDITVKATSGNITIEAGTSITLKVGQCKIEITTSGITVKGTQVSINSDAGTEVKSSAITTVKGSLVQIN